MVLNKTFSVIVRSGAVLEVDGGSILNARLVVQKGGTVIVKNNGLIKLRAGSDFDMEKGAILDSLLEQLTYLDKRTESAVG